MLNKTTAPIKSIINRNGPINLRHSRSDVHVTVFGATGFLGRYVINAIGRTGATIHIPTRGDDNSWKHLRPLADYGKMVPHFISIKDEVSLYKSIEKSNIVVNLMGKHYDTKHFPPTKINWTIEDSNIKTAETIAKISRKVGIQHLVHVSSLLAHPNSTSRLGKAKLLGEKAVLREFPGATIIRPGVMYGEEDRFLNWYARLAISLPFLPVVNGGKATVYPVFVGDVAEAISAISVGENCLDCVDEVFELPGLDKLSHKDITSYVYEQLRREDKTLDIPLSVGNVAAKIWELLPTPTLTVDTLSVLQDSELLNAVPRAGENGKPKEIRSWNSLINIKPHQFHSKAFNYLYRYRTGGHFRDIRLKDEKKPKEEVVLN